MDPRLQAAIKAETDDTITVAGWGVVFGAADLYGTRFVPETDYWLDKLGDTKITLYDHGLNEAVKQVVVGKAKVTPMDDGLWVEAELEKHNRYVQQIAKLVEAQAIGWSSGAVAHLVTGADAADGVFTYKSWPIVEMSLTPTPAEPRTLGVAEVRALIGTGTGDEQNPTLKSLLPEDAPAEESAPEAASAAAEITVSDLSDPPTTPTKNATEKHMEINELAEQVKGLSTTLDRVLKHLEDTPAIRNAGYITQDGGTADKNVKSFGDWLLAVKRHDVTRLAKVYGSLKDLTEGDGTGGGYLVPTDMRSELMRVVYEQSPIVGLCQRQPVTTAAGQWPALDQFVAPTAGAGNTALAAGVAPTIVAEGGTLTETTPAFLELFWRVYKRGGYTLVSNELVQDSATSIEQLLRSLFAISIASRLERDILRGTGDGEPLGIFNAPCAVGVATVADNTFAWADALAMMARFKQVSGSAARTRWIMHQSVLPDFGLAGWVTGTRERQITDLGYGTPILSEHMNQANGDDVLLADLGSYILFVRDELSIAYSEHVNFLTDKGTWRFTSRLDGQPWLRNAITLADPQGSYTVAPFVYHDD